VATFGGLWQALSFGVLGLRPLPHALLVDPHVPGSWQRLRMRVRFHGARLDIQAWRDAVCIASTAPVDVVLPHTGPGVVPAVRVLPGRMGRWRRAGDAGWELE
jgi:hypothetical protein